MVADIATARAEEQRRSLRRHWADRVLPPFRPLLPPARYKGAYGGRGGAKSHFFAENALMRCLERPTRIVCIREVQKSLDQSVKRLLEDKIEVMGLTGFESLTTHIRPPGGRISFQGMQDHTAESMKSFEGFDIAWVEEAQSLSQRSLDLLRPTIRKRGSELWFSWNPREATDPVDALLRSKEPPPGSVVVRTGWEDNPYLSEAMRAELEWDRRRDPDKFAHVWGGAYRKLSEARVFRNWRVEAFQTPSDASFLLGGDWGFATDPNVLVRAFLKERTLYVDAEAYEVGCTLDDTPDLFDSLTCGDACGVRRGLRPGEDKGRCLRPGHGMARRWRITADSARPETINHMRRHGYQKIEPSVKGANSVEEGVEFLKSYDIVVHPRCQHTIDELTYYSYKTEELTGRVLPILQDKKNHVIDSLRYAIEELRRATAARGGLVW